MPEYCEHDMEIGSIGHEACTPEPEDKFLSRLDDVLKGRHLCLVRS